MESDGIRDINTDGRCYCGCTDISDITSNENRHEYFIGIIFNFFERLCSRLLLLVKGVCFVWRDTTESCFARGKEHCEENKKEKGNSR